MWEGGKFTPNPLFVLPFPNHLGLMDAPWTHFLAARWRFQTIVSTFQKSKMAAGKPENITISENSCYRCFYHNNMSFRSTVIPTSRVVADILSSGCRPARPMSNKLTNIHTISSFLDGDMGNPLNHNTATFIRMTS